MSRKGFVDNNLIGLKDKLRKEQQNMKPVTTLIESEQAVSKTLPSQINEQNKNIEEDKKIKPSPSPSPCISTTKANIALDQDGAKEEAIAIDKEYFKALIERKKEFIHTRSDILKRIKQNLEKLPVDIERYEKLLIESNKIKTKLTLVVEDIDTIKEKEWDKKNFSFDLANATKKIENARLELFTLQQKTDCLLEDEVPGLEKNPNSFVPELTSLSPGQIFKMGVSFFLPLIIGLLLTGVLISIAMFIAMGVI
jgi:hypothetical protein